MLSPQLAAFIVIPTQFGVIPNVERDLIDSARIIRELF